MDGTAVRKEGYDFFMDVCTRCLRLEEEFGDLAQGKLKEVEDEVEVVETGRLESSEESCDPGSLD